jgi:hypothetical protein
LVVEHDLFQKPLHTFWDHALDMPMLVHIASEKDIGSIRCAGLRVPKERNGVYAMPVLKNFMVGHQWLRELKRNGGRTLCAVHFRIPTARLC